MATEADKFLYQSAESLGGRTIDTRPVEFWMDKIKNENAPRPTSSEGNAQLAYAQAQWALKNPAVEKQIREARGVPIISPVPLYEAYGLTPPQAEAPAKAAGGGSVWDKIKSYVDSRASSGGNQNLIKPIQPVAAGGDNGGGLNLGAWDEVQKIGNSAAGYAKGTAGIVADPFGLNRGVIDVVTGKPWSPSGQLGNVAQDWQNVAGFAGDYNPVMWPATAAAGVLGQPSPGELIKGGLGNGINGITKGTPVDQNPGAGKGGGSTMGDDIPMPELGGYQSAFGGMNANTLAPSGVPYSAWKGMALDKQGAEESKMMSDAASQSAGGLANARAQLAMRGGLRGGAAERLARGGNSDLLGARQNVMGQGVINRANIGMQGAQMDTDVNKFNANMGNDAQKFNIQNSINDISGANDWQKLKYSEGMKLKGAGMTGQAIKNAGKK